MDKDDLKSALAFQPASKPRQPKQPADSRQERRCPYSGRVYRLDHSGAAFAAVDLSPEGVGLLSAEQLNEGQLLKLSFLNGSIEVKGSVRHVRRVDLQVWRLGIKFLQNEHELAEVALATC